MIVNNDQIIISEAKLIPDFFKSKTKEMIRIGTDIRTKVALFVLNSGNYNEVFIQTHSDSNKYIYLGSINNYLNGYDKNASIFTNIQSIFLDNKGNPIGLTEKNIFEYADKQNSIEEFLFNNNARPTVNNMHNFLQTQNHFQVAMFNYKFNDSTKFTGNEIYLNEINNAYIRTYYEMGLFQKHNIVNGIDITKNELTTAEIEQVLIAKTINFEQYRIFLTKVSRSYFEFHNVKFHALYERSVRMFNN